MDYLARCRGRNRKAWRECVKDDMEVHGLQPEWVVFRDMWRDFKRVTSNVSLSWKK